MDCILCEGDAQREGTDCPMCGGSGYAPPIKAPDRSCADCGRGLWLGARGPRWFEHKITGRALCRWCLAAKTETIRPKATGRAEEILAPDVLN